MDLASIFGVIYITIKCLRNPRNLHVYEVGLPNVSLSDFGGMRIYLQVATNMSPAQLDIQVVAFDPADNAALGLTDLVDTNNQTSKLIFDGSNYLKVDPQTGGILKWPGTTWSKLPENWPATGVNSSASPGPGNSFQ